MGESGHRTCWSWGSGKSSWGCAETPVVLPQLRDSEGCRAGSTTRAVAINRVPSQTRASYKAHWWQSTCWSGLLQCSLMNKDISLRVWDGKTEILNLLLPAQPCPRHHLVKKEHTIFSPPGSWKKAPVLNNAEILRPLSNCLEADILLYPSFTLWQNKWEENGQTLVEQNNKSSCHLTRLAS